MKTQTAPNTRAVQTPEVCLAEEVRMQSSMFNVRVPLEQVAASAGDVFLMNTFTDAQVIVSRDVAELVDRLQDAWSDERVATLGEREREVLATLAEQGFVVGDRASERRQLEDFFEAIGRPKLPGQPAPEPFPRPADALRIEAETVFTKLD